MQQSAQFSVLKLFGYWQQNLPSLYDKPSFNMTWNLQMNQDTLFGSEMFGLGGNGSVRGFKKYSLSGKGGYSIQNTMTFKPEPVFKTQPGTGKLHP